MSEKVHTTALRILLATILGLFPGCASPPDETAPGQRETAAPELPPPLCRTFLAGESVRGRPIVCHLLGHGEETVLVLAAIHGNEGLGTPLVERLRTHLLAHPELLSGRRVAIVPVANPDGLASGRRKNDRGVDLNRNFPAANFRGGSGGPHPLSEPESAALYALIHRSPPSRVVSVHQPLGLIDHDGPGEALARAMARESGLRLKRLGGRPGSLGSYVGRDLGIPIVTVELPRHGGIIDEEELWSRYGRMLLTAVTWPGGVPPGRR
jgi:protein MpaA